MPWQCSLPWPATPRPAYHDDPERIYEMRYGAWIVRFSVNGDTLTVCSVE